MAGVRVRSSVVRTDDSGDSVGVTGGALHPTKLTVNTTAQRMEDFCIHGSGRETSARRGWVEGGRLSPAERQWSAASRAIRAVCRLRGDEGNVGARVGKMASGLQ